MRVPRLQFVVGSGMLCGLLLPLFMQGVTLEVAPSDLRLYPRNAENLGTLEVTGLWSPETMEETLRLEVTNEAGQVRTMEAKQDLLGAMLAPQPFHLQVQVPAGLFDYEAFLIRSHSGVDVILDSWSGIAVGDVLFVHGQSNAVASDAYSQDLANEMDQSRWIRSFGTTSTNASEVLADLSWHIADGEAAGSSGAIGSWGLDLAKQIVDAEGIPVAVLNGAVGGTVVSQHQRNDVQREDLGTIYGRLLFRARHAGVKNAVRAMFWYQGESEGSNVLGWRDGFRSMVDDWEEDYPNIEHFWIVQVRRGCGAPILALRDFQRRLCHARDDFHGATSNGLRGHDGCHFRYQGYEDLGSQLGPQVAHWLYGHPLPFDSTAPDVLSASWTSAAQDAIFLDFRNVTASFSIPQGSWETFVLDDGTQVVGAITLGFRLRLDLAGPSTATTLGFRGTQGGGKPWIRNIRGLALMSFDGVEIQ